MARLNIRIDQVAALRGFSGAKIPDPVQVAVMAELAGADGIAIYLGEDRHHPRERDLYLLRNVLQGDLILEMAPSEKMVEKALEVKPEMVTLVPEIPERLAVGKGLDLDNSYDQLSELIPRLQAQDMLVALFITPEVEAVKKAAKLKADYVELSTTAYGQAKNSADRAEALEALSSMAALASKLLLGVSGGRGLDYRNVKQVVEIGQFEEFSIGRAIICRAVFVGIERAVKEMIELVKG